MGDISLIYSVIDGYKIKVKIFNKKKEVGYFWEFEADYGKPDVFFVDINNDKHEDIFLKLSGEGEYDLVILINIKDIRFVEALPESKYTNYIFNYDYFSKKRSEETKNIQIKEFLMKDLDNDGINEVVFNHLYINGKLYNPSIFYFDKTKTKLLLEDIKDVHK